MLHAAMSSPAVRYHIGGTDEIELNEVDLESDEFLAGSPSSPAATGGSTAPGSGYVTVKKSHLLWATALVFFALAAITLLLGSRVYTQSADTDSTALRSNNNGLFLPIRADASLGSDIDLNHFGRDTASTASFTLRDSIQSQHLMDHLQQLTVAAASSVSEYGHATRVIGSSGFSQTIDYVQSVLKQHSDYWTYRLQCFTVDVHKVNSIPQLELMSSDATEKLLQPAWMADFMGMTGSASGDVSAVVTVVSNGGCNDTDYVDSLVAQRVALIKRGGCFFVDKVEQATKHGAVAAIIYNSGEDDAHFGLFHAGVRRSSIPLLTTSYNFGNYMREHVSDSFTARVMVNVTNSQLEVPNVIADSIAGDSSSVVVLGAHSDSVEAGAGIHDDGSGTAMLLEFAKQLAQTNIKVTNKIRLIWNAAEEEGLLGSYAYTKTLLNDSAASAMQQTGADVAAQRISDIVCYLGNSNFDMVGGTNGLPFVMDGTDFSGTSPDMLPATTNDTLTASNTLRHLLSDYMAAALHWQAVYTPQDGRSDYAGYSDLDLPISGLETGAEVLKTAAQRTTHGGLAQTPYDSCYHSACDTMENVSPTTFAAMGQTAAYVTENLAIKTNVRHWLRHQYLNPINVTLPEHVNAAAVP